MSDLESEYYEKCEATLEALGKEGLPALAIFSPANPKKPIVLHSAWSKSTLLEQLAVAVEENRKVPGNRVTSK